MTRPAEYGHGENAEGDPGPVVTSTKPRTSSSRVEAREVVADGKIRIVAVLGGLRGDPPREELVFDGNAFLSPYAHESTIAALLGGGRRYSITRTIGWPPGPTALRVEAVGEGESVCAGGGLTSGPS